MESSLVGVDSFFSNHLGSAILLSILLLGVGIGIGKLAIPLLKDFFGKGTVNVNIGERESQERKGRKMCIPEDCPEHLAEQERSHRNEEEIKLIWAQFGVLRTELVGKLSVIEDGNRQILLALVEKGQLRARDIKKGG